MFQVGQVAPSSIGSGPANRLMTEPQLFQVGQATQLRPGLAPSTDCSREVQQSQVREVAQLRSGTGPVNWLSTREEQLFQVGQVTQLRPGSAPSTPLRWSHRSCRLVRSPRFVPGSAPSTRCPTAAAYRHGRRQLVVTKSHSPMRLSLSQLALWLQVGPQVAVVERDERGPVRRHVPAVFGRVRQTHRHRRGRQPAPDRNRGREDPRPAAAAARPTRRPPRAAEAANSMRSSASRRAVMRTSAPARPVIARPRRAHRELRARQPAAQRHVAVAGKNCSRGSSPLAPAIVRQWRCCSANSVRPSARRCAVMRSLRLVARAGGGDGRHAQHRDQRGHGPEPPDAPRIK